MALNFVDWRPRFPAAITALLGIVLASAVARAGTVSRPSGPTVQFQAAAGEVNSIILSKSGTSIIIGDGMPVTLAPGSGCSPVPGNPNQVSCPLAGLSSVSVLAGDMNDQIMSTIGQAGLALALDGQQGDDWIEGGPGNDFLIGGNGCDTFDGQGGYDNISGGANGMGCFDTVNYEEVTPNPSTGAGVTVIVGGTGGTDMVNEDVETIIGSAGHDFIQGDGVDGTDSDDRDFIFGGAGDDFIYGGGGVDQLVGGTGNDQVYGEGDDDQVTADGSFAAGDGTADDYIDCGPGTDVSWGEAGDGLIFGAAQQFKDCETKHIHASCGDGTVGPGETCDDGNLQNGDCCSQTCQAEPSGGTCNDGNACTLTDACNASGACVGSNPVTCSAQDECHDVGTCNTTTGSCSNPAKPDGTACTDDANVCTSDTCQAGVCSHPPVANGTSCTDDGNACTTDSCQGGACSHPPVADGTGCADDENACTSDVCQSGTCSHPPVANGTACADDGNACTTDSCQGGACSHPPVANGTGCADDGNTCTSDSCQSGLCSHPPVADGTSCPDDGSVCTSDSCQAGSCAHPPVPNGTGCVDDGNVCTGDACQEGVCAHPPVADNTPCPDDGNTCTVDVCTAGVCGGTCRENTPCTAGEDTICRVEAGGACGCAPAPDPPDPMSVAPPLDPSVATDPATATAFLYTGSTPVQAGVAPGTINPRRAALVRGRVTTRDGAALAGVRASFVGHDELGWTRTRSDGRFDLVVNGGGLLTVRLAKTGYLPVDRQVEVPWQDYVSLADVVLVLKDTATTVVDLTAATPIQVARGSVVNDPPDGTRQPTILVEQGTQAWLVFANGTTQQTTAFTVRATEYTVGPTGPAAMPATLPATSEYTHAVELAADEVESAGAVRLEFDRPVYYYVENFLGLPVGLSVPTGYYDRERAQWVAAPSGRIIKILTITGGQADVDADGDGDADSAAELAALGITSAERTQLAMLYVATQTLWRVPTAHFTPWDYNFPWGPPPGAGDPMNPPPAPGGGPGGTGGGTPPPNCGSGSAGTGCPPPPGECVTPGSSIRCESQTLGEARPVTGTPFTLNYQSERVRDFGAARTLDVPLSVATFPGPVKHIEVTATLGGERSVQTFPATPNQATTLTWSGQDVYGRSHQGAIPYTVDVAYVYDAVYGTAERFADFPTSLIAGSRARREISFIQRSRGMLGTWEALGHGLGGWSLDVHHAYDPQGRVLYLGTGSRRVATALGQRIAHVAGTGVAGSTGDGGLATSARLNNPWGLAVGADGSVYIADSQNDRIRKVSSAGIITTVAGCVTASPCVTGDGGQATSARLEVPQDVAVAPDGSLYIADSGHNTVRRVAPSGIISTVAGTGVFGYSGDGGPATAAQIVASRIALGPDGSVYISSMATGMSVVRRVGPDGVITTVAGTGPSAYGGDGGLATAAQLRNPTGIAVGRDGSLYIADQSNQRIRRVTPDGIITTVVGTGQSGCASTGDGGLATAARTCTPQGVALGPLGTIYIAEGNNRVRAVTSDGIIRTLAGTGTAGSSGLNGPAAAAQINQSRGVAVGSDGEVYVAELANRRVTKVGPALTGLTGSEVLIPAPDGRELYVFGAQGRHLRTLDALTAAVQYTFGYDPAGRLQTITDGSGNVTRVQRLGSGEPVAIEAPGGQITTLGRDANGYLDRIENPAGEAAQFTYTAGGLLRFFTTPRNHQYEFRYDAQGRLELDLDPAGGSQALARAVTGATEQVTITTGLLRQTRYRTERLSDGTTARRVTVPSGHASETVSGPDAGSETSSQADGTQTTAARRPDPRFGMQAPLTSIRQVTTPGGRTLTLTESRTVTLANPLDPLSLTAGTTTRGRNGRNTVETYAAGPRTITMQTPAGRQQITTLDSLGRVIGEQLGPLALTSFAYDTAGRLQTVTRGSGADARTYTFGYDPMNRLTSITDPTTRVTTFQSDAADRVIVQTLPDTREIGFGYDANGNVASVTPAGRPAHTFAFTPVDQNNQYVPPTVPDAGTVSTTYGYNLDRQLDLITRPDGQTVDLGYDAVGRLDAIATPTGTTTFGYDATTGNLSSIATPDSGTLSFGYDGAFLTAAAWTGPVTGSVAYTYDNDLRISSSSVDGGHTIAFQYDADSLLTQAGDLTLTRDAQTGLVAATSLGQVAEARTYNAFGEIATQTVTVGGVEQLKIEYLGRDNLARITAKRETIGVQANTYGYSYDSAGRLEAVTKDGLTVATYTYDANGNRLSAPNLTSVPTYDDQDRLLAYENATYTYTANGELQTKTVAGQTTTYAYDVVGNLRQVTLPSGTTVEYVIDGMNRRIGKKVNGALVQGWLYEDPLQPAAELDGNGNVVARFVYGTQANVPDYVVKGGVTYKVVTDHLGSPRLVINAADGTIAQRMAFDEFGRLLDETNSGFQPFGFAGGLYDGDTGLVRFGARDYDPRTGRWTAKDRILFAGGDPNLYGYVLADPVNLTDPSGDMPPWLLQIYRILLLLGRLFFGGSGGEPPPLPPTPRPPVIRPTGPNPKGPGPKPGVAPPLPGFPPTPCA